MSELSSSNQPPDDVAAAAGSLFGGVIVAISMVFVTLFVFSLFGRFSYVAELVSNFRIQILLPLVPCTVLTVVCQRWYISLLLVLCTIWCAMGVLTVYLPANQPAPGEHTIRVMSFNVLAASRQYQPVKQQIKKNDPDVLVVIEYDHDWHRELEYLTADDLYPYHHRVPRWHGFGVAIFSRLPISNRQVFQLTGKVTDAPMAVCEIGSADHKIRLAGMHVFSPTSRHRLILRNSQIAEAAQILANNDIPTIAVGDFNCVPWSPFLDDFLQATGYRDSRQGFGYQGTWNARYRWFALIPIDHAFISDEIHIHDRFVGETTSSDHYPIVLDVSVDW